MIKKYHIIVETSTAKYLLLEYFHKKNINVYDVSGYYDNFILHFEIDLSIYNPVNIDEEIQTLLYK